MLTRFITWLVVRFLSQTDLLKIVSDRLMTKGRDRIVMQNLYTVHDDHRKGDIDHVSFNQLCLNNLSSKFGIKQLSGILMLEYLKMNAVCCPAPDCDGIEKLFTDLRAAVGEKNYLKRQTNVKEILRSVLINVDESELALLATVVIENNYSPETAVAYFKHI